MSMYTYTTWVVHAPNLGKVPSIPWQQLYPQKLLDGQCDYYMALTLSCGGLPNVGEKGDKKLKLSSFHDVNLIHALIK